VRSTVGRFALRRTLVALVVLWVGSLFTFLIINLAPGNVAVLVAEKRAGASATGDTIRAIERELGLDRPLLVRYADWLWQAVQGDLGVSLQRNLQVTDELAARAGDTVLLVTGAAVLALVLGAGLGLAGALWPGSLLDRIGRALALLAASIPSFYAAALLVLVLGLQLALLPTFGNAGPESWVMPWTALALAPAGVLSRVVRVSLERAMTEPYVVTAVSKGFGRRRILLRDALPNVAPSLLAVYATQVGLMIPGAVVVESIFAWQGIGSYFLDAVRFRDVFVLQSTLLVFVVAFVVLNALVDIAQAFLDPRVRRATQAGAS
jgi:peptide/nickel transport system permease protein